MSWKNKTGTEVASALQKVIKKRKPEKLWVDKGKEFYNKHVQQLVELYSTKTKRNLASLSVGIEP